MENIGDNPTSVGPFRANARNPTPPLAHLATHRKQDIRLGYEDPTMATSLPTAADLPALPNLDAQPHTASPDHPTARAGQLASLSMEARFDNIPFLWQDEVIVITSPHHGDCSPARPWRPNHTDSEWDASPYLPGRFHGSHAPASLCIDAGYTRQNNLSSF